MNTAPCNCHTQTVKPSLNERPRFYARQLVTPDDLTLEQDYFRARLRRHNRYLHGWGVVCGAQVVPAYFIDSAGAKKPKPWKVIVKAGYVLGPYGDEIFIETDQCVDVRKRCVTPETPDDEECLEAHPAPTQGEAEDQWLAIRYVEKKTRLVKVPLGGCGCEDSSCEHTRFQDYYEICVIDHCPESHQNPPDPPKFGDQQSKPEAPACPECQEEPWVVLSTFTVDAEGTVTLSQCACRRQVLTFADFWWTCSVPEGAPQPTDQPPTTTGTRDTTGRTSTAGAAPTLGTSRPLEVDTSRPVTPVASTERNVLEPSRVSAASGASKRTPSKTGSKKKPT